MGYARTGSLPSIIAGSAVGILCTLGRRPILVGFDIANHCLDGIGGYRIQNREPYGVELSLLASIVLGGSAIPRAIRLKKPVPVVLSIISTFGMFTFGKAYKNQL